MGFSCLDCMKRFSQVVLVVTNIFVLVLGLAVMILGIWAKLNGKDYVDITEDTSSYTQFSVLCIVVGLFVLILGSVGTVGAIFASTIFGRITLVVYAAVLTLLVICEIISGIAAAVKRDDLQSVYNVSINKTFSQYSKDPAKQSAWDTFQKAFKCCGVNNASDYERILNISTPESCCVDSTTCEGKGGDSEISVFFSKGCASVVIDEFKHNLGIIAGIIIFIGLIQIFGIVMACFVAIYKRNDGKYEVV